MGYYLDLSAISLSNYKEKLKNGDLLPSRMILKDKIDERFGYFTKNGINNVEGLLKFLKKKGQIEKLSTEGIFSEDYLKILLREINSLQPKPNKFSDFEGISADTVLKLEKAGIKYTAAFYDKVKTTQMRKALADNTGIHEEEILELAKLTDLSRIRWVGAAFARMLYNVGIDTVEKAAAANPVELHETINRINLEMGFYKGKIGLHDMQLFVEAAKEITPEIEY